MTQADQIRTHLERYGSITQLEAMREYGIMRLGARIYDLKKSGLLIESKTETTKNRYGKPVSYARYTLHE